MAREVKCSICSNKISKDEAYCVETVGSTGRITRKYYCSEQEYLEDKENKALWKNLLVKVDEILGYTCISKTKVNMIKDIEANYTRKQLYNCLCNNAEEIKRYLDEKGIYDEYGKLSYIFACIRNKIKDSSEQTTMSATQIDIEDITFETEEDILKRIDEDRSRSFKGGLLDILNKIDRGR